MVCKDAYGILPVSIDESHELSCPNCEQAYGLHQYKYRISAPEYHDKKSVVVDGGTLSHHDSVGWNLDDSRPRESIEIKFWCEICQADDMRLQIIQHKGVTLIHWGKYE